MLIDDSHLRIKHRMNNGCGATLRAITCISLWYENSIRNQWQQEIVLVVTHHTSPYMRGWSILFVLNAGARLCGAECAESFTMDLFSKRLAYPPKYIEADYSEFSYQNISWREKPWIFIILPSSMWSLPLQPSDNILKATKHLQLGHPQPLRPAQMCDVGWQESRERSVLLVECETASASTISLQKRCPQNIPLINILYAPQNLARKTE